MKAEIITIGDEILIGQIVDSNSAWIARELNSIGILVTQISSISDKEKAIINALDSALERVSLVLLTGGLGPTDDDITKKALCRYFNMDLVCNDEILRGIKERLAIKGIPMSKRNQDQALVPSGCRIIPNYLGTAPCMWFEKERRVVISMPGVPSEMKGIMRNGVVGALSAHFETPKILHKTVLVQGLGESTLADRIKKWEEQLPAGIKLAYLPSPGLVRLRLSLQGSNDNDLKKIVKEEVNKLQEIIPENIFGYDEETLEEIVGNMLRERGQTMGTAESCTGGNIAHLITLHPGSSDFFKGSIVAYSNEVKEKLLGVSSLDLERHGAVSRPVVEQMAKGACKCLRVDYAIATSGIAGPTGGTEEKPVGTVWIAVAGHTGVCAEKFVFSSNRENNILMASLKGLNMLRSLLTGTPKQE